MEDIHRTHKEPAWGWIGAVLQARRPAAPVPDTRAADKPAARPGSRLRPGRAAC